MKPKHFVALAIALVVLLGIRWAVSHRGGGSAHTLSEAGLRRVVAKDVDPATITWIQVTPPAPAAPEQASGATGPAPTAPPAPAPARFEKRDGSWVLAKDGAPADAKAIDEFVAKALALEGETRGSGKDAWTTFGLGDSEAVKVELGAGAQPAAVLWLGKQGDTPEAHFVRVEGSDDVLHVSEGIRGALGLYGPGGAPAADLWLSRDVIGVKAADATRFTVERPDMKLVLEKREAEAAGASGATGPAPAATWTVTEPALTWTAKTNLDQVVDRAGSSRISAALDAESAECKAEPVATITFGLASGDRVVRLRGKVEGKDEIALTIDGQPHCWSISTWAVGSLLPKAPAIWDVPALNLASADLTHLKVDRGGKVATATKADKDWKVTGAGLDASRAPGIASALRYLRIEDVARDPGSSPVTATLSGDSGGKPVVLRLLGERPGGFGERYARADGAALPPGWVLVLSKGSADALQ